MARKPSFLLFVTDQQRADHLGCYGNRVLRTPHIDALARKGLRFDNHHVATPICQPNRASLMTGRLPSAHGLRMNGLELSLAETTFVELLRAAGWRTALVGKAHLQNITHFPPAWPQPRPVHDALRPAPGRYGQEVGARWAADEAFGLDLPYYGFEQVRLSIGHGDDQQGDWRRWLRREHPQAEALVGRANALPTPGSPMGRLGQAWRTRLPEALHPTNWIADQTCVMLQQYAQADAPFFLQCSIPDPHHPFTPPGRYWDMYRPEDVELPASFGADLVDPPPAMAALREQRRTQADFQPGYAAFAADEAEVREALALNYGNIALIDAAVGRVMAQLQALGLDQDTVVGFTSDHGDLLGDRGLMFKGGLHYRSITRTPLIWRDPAAQGRAGEVTQALAQTIDIAPTILQRAGIAPVHGMQGRALLDDTPERTHLLIEEESQRADFDLDRRLRMRTLLTATHRLTVYDGQDWGEFYGLVDDPLELRNLWNDPASRMARAEGMEALARAMLAATDQSPCPTAPA